MCYRSGQFYLSATPIDQRGKRRPLPDGAPIRTLRDVIQFTNRAYIFDMTANPVLAHIQEHSP